jgi:hypothetical protein
MFLNGPCGQARRRAGEPGPVVASGNASANPGGHLAVPAFELDSSERFFLRHLGPG